MTCIYNISVAKLYSDTLLVQQLHIRAESCDSHHDSFAVLDTSSFMYPDRSSDRYPPAYQRSLRHDQDQDAEQSASKDFPVKNVQLQVVLRKEALIQLVNNFKASRRSRLQKRDCHPTARYVSSRTS